MLKVDDLHAGQYLGFTIPHLGWATPSKSENTYIGVGTSLACLLPLFIGHIDEG
jgi:hypothetical protein